MVPFFLQYHYYTTVIKNMQIIANFYFLSYSTIDYIKKYEEIMESASAENEQVPDRVHEPGLFRIIKYYPEGIEQAANQQKSKAARRDQIHQRLDREDNRPAHQQIQYQRQLMPLL